MQDASKLNWALKSFPKEDFRGFWVCYSTKNLLSNDTKISFLQIFSEFNPISTRLLVLLLCMAVKQSDNEHFIETILCFPDDVQHNLRYFIEATLEQIDNGVLCSGDIILGG